MKIANGLHTFDPRLDAPTRHYCHTGSWCAHPIPTPIVAPLGAAMMAPTPENVTNEVEKWEAAQRQLRHPGSGDSFRVVRTSSGVQTAAPSHTQARSAPGAPAHVAVAVEELNSISNGLALHVDAMADGSPVSSAAGGCGCGGGELHRRHPPVLCLRALSARVRSHAQAHI